MVRVETDPFALLRDHARKAIAEASPVSHRSVNGRPFSEVARAAISEQKPSRNAPCPCRSGKKYKKCCG